MKLIDRFDRVHDYLRISLTDKCNFQCQYCNPDGMRNHLSEKKNILTFEEILRIIKIFSAELGFKKFRFTGGEPLVRKGIFYFFHEVKKLKEYNDFEVGITTNGSLLAGNTQKLKENGIDKLNISLDTLKKDRFISITGRDELSNVTNVIEEAVENGFTPVKINAVIIKGVNDDEILDFIEFVKNRNVNIRFIEFMPFGNNDWQKDGFISFREINEIVSQQYKLVPIINDKNSVAKDYQIVGHEGKVSFISSISEHFCSSCNRVRITSDGKFRLCLFTDGKHELNFKDLFRACFSDEEIINQLHNVVNNKWEKHPTSEELVNMESNNMLRIGG